MSRVLLTGATGFVGMEVLARLLAESDDAVVALVRAPDAAEAAARMDGVLRRLGLQAHAARVETVRGDITLPGLGLAPDERAALGARLDAIVHCAASVSFSLGLAESREINVAGTRRVLELADAAPGLRRLVHVSTAYVAGTHVGRFAEDDLARGQAFRNAYEQTKHEAEEMVAARTDLPISVVRPSIVVGDSHSGWTTAFNVVYFPLQAFSRGLASAVPADPDAVVDIVPVDYVAEGILAALRAPETMRVAMVAGERAVRVAELCELAARYFDRPAPELVELAAFDSDSPVLEQMEIYFPYFSVQARFDDAHARSLGLEAPRLASYFDAIMDFAVEARWGKREPRRAVPVPLPTLPSAPAA